MRIVDPFIQLKEYPNTTNILKLISAMSTQQLKISEIEVDELFKVIDSDFELQHFSVVDFDKELWKRLEAVDISIDWIEVILAYNRDKLIQKKPDLKVVNQSNQVISTVNDAIQSYAQERNSLIPKSFADVEEAYSGNDFIKDLRNDREKLISVMWDLYHFHPKNKLEKKEISNSLDWDIFYRLVSFAYSKILNNKDEKNKIKEGNKESQSADFYFQDFKEKGVAISTLLFLSPIACSRNFENYANTLASFAKEHIGENTLTALFDLYSMGHLKKIKSDSPPTYESNWILPNIISLQAAFFGFFLDSKKYYQLLLAYKADAYEIDYSDYPNGAASDFSTLISSLVCLASPTFVTETDISKFLRVFEVVSSDSDSIAKRICDRKTDLLNLNSVSLLLSEPILDSTIDEFNIESHLEATYLKLLENSGAVPQKEALWGAVDVSDFDGITYRSVYFKNSRSLLVASSTFYGIGYDPISLAIDGAQSLIEEGFHKISLTYLCYNLLNFIDTSAYGSKTGLDPTTHRKLSRLLINLKLDKHINTSYFQILSYCSIQKELFGPLFCEVLGSMISEFKFDNVIQLNRTSRANSESDGVQSQIEKAPELGSWASSEANESFAKICLEISSITSKPADGIWERKYKSIRGDVDALLTEIDEICTSEFKGFYFAALIELSKTKEERWSDFRNKFDSSKRVSLGTITTFFSEVQRIRSDSEQSISSLKNIFDDKKCFNTLRLISEENQLLISLNNLRSLRNLFSHKTQRLKWTKVREIINFLNYEINDYLKLFK
jgi:hypothetical protein